MKLHIILTSFLISCIPANGMDKQSKQPLYTSNFRCFSFIEFKSELQKASMETSSRLAKDRAQARKKEQEQLDRETKNISRVGTALALVVGSLAVVAAYGLLAATHANS